jgi:hypothetical protein
MSKAALFAAVCMREEMHTRLSKPFAMSSLIVIGFHPS